MGLVNSAKLLLNTAESLPSRNHTYDLIKSHFRSLSRSFLKAKHPLPAQIYGSTVCCRTCSAKWADGDFRMKIIPRRARGSKAEKMVKALNSGAKLSRKQRCRAKWYRRRLHAILKITCLLCKNILKMPLKKIKQKKNPDEKTLQKASTKNTTTECQNKTRKNQEKKAVVQLENTNTKPKASKKRGHTIEKVSDYKNILSKMMPKKKKKVKKAPEPTSKPSKTKQKNTLLQLAEMLKNSGSKKKEAENNKLKMLLR